MDLIVTTLPKRKYQFDKRCVVFDKHSRMYLKRDGTWTERYDRAMLFTDPGDASRWMQGKQRENECAMKVFL